MWKILTAASTALVLVGTPALAQWDTWDVNDDDFIDQSEFDSHIDVPGLFNDIDLNEDDQLDEEEWTTSFGDSFDEERIGSYDVWDEDESGFLSADEFDTGVFDIYDANDDDMWDQEEFGVYEDEGLF